MNEITEEVKERLSGIIDIFHGLFNGLDPHFVADSIGYSFTILVGFVAIGIPLSLQVISRATEKYNSAHIIRYLSSWRLITPKRIYWGLILYFILSLTFKSLLPVDGESDISFLMQVYAWAVALMCLAIVLALGMWFSHIFSQASKRPREIYDSLKRGVEPHVGARRGRYLDQLNARIDIVREGLSSNPLDVELEEPITELMKEVRPLVFNEDWVVPVQSNEWLVVVNFILSLNEVSRAARKNNRSLNFSAQRSVFVLLGYIFNHPQFSELCGSRRSRPTKAPFLNLTQIMYSEAERQNYDPCSYDDLYAEGEWLSNIMGLFMRARDFSLNPEGLDAALNLWESLVAYAARNNPNRLTKLHQSLKEAATSGLYKKQLAPVMLGENEKFSMWRKRFNNLKPFKISKLNQCEEALGVLHGDEAKGEWSEFNGCFGHESKFLKQTLPNVSDIRVTCIQSSALDSIAYFFALCALNNSWSELKESWYQYQPKDADANYIQYGLFNRDLGSFSDWINEHVLSLDNKFYERHNIKSYAASACVVILAEMLSLGNPPSFRLLSIEQSEKLEQFIVLLKSKSQLIMRESVRDAFDWDYPEAHRIKIQVDDFLDTELENCKQYTVKQLKNCVPEASNPDDLKLIYQSWSQTNSNFWIRFNQIRKDYLAIKVKFANNIFPNTVEVPFNTGPAYSLSARSGKVIHGIEFNGIQLAEQLEAELIQKLKSLARSTSTPGNAGSMWFICEDDRNTGRFNKVLAQYGFNSKTDRIRYIQGQESFVVEKNAVGLVFHQWKFMPWANEAQDPIVVYGFTKYSGDISGISSLHYFLEVHNPLGIWKV
ncbi:MULTISPECIES: hypothetical protein [Gammaproteobacteria]|uniref:hypothetical protein n=1 Tax=Gammaproteobacteria TaxID=1236 RepID=UPI000DCF9529|nr:MULTISPECIES: hypothetical protein [Gammaproteobacteria]RTE86567.1 hypothetical protein DQX04_08415 [Aliidiomarina sp. B3213]TCZ90878.1 hypothetical protein EYQ95_08630 [Lysobacter sp. N42]